MIKMGLGLMVSAYLALWPINNGPMYFLAVHAGSFGR